VNKLFRSTAFRFALASVAMSALILVALVSHLLLRTNQNASSYIYDSIGLEIQELQSLVKLRGLAGLSATLADRAREHPSRRYLLVNAAGHKLGGSLPADARPHPETGLIAFSDVIGGPSGERLAIGQSALLADGHQLVVARDIDDQRALTRRIQWLTLLGISLLSLLGLGTAALIARDHSRRLDGVAEQSRAIMAGDLSRRLPLDGSGDEFDRLSINLNAMLGRIEELMIALREVSDNIAHDLRTPLTRLRNRAESALRDAEGANAHRTGLEKTIEEADELIKTFNALLLIARLEGGASADAMETVDVAAIVNDVGELYQPVAEEAGLELAITVSRELPARANRQLLGQAIANLVDNAIKYASAGASIRKIAITASRVAQTVEISVSDHGAGIAEADRAQVLKRFVRLEKSRSQPGTGLGLSLVAAVARLHAGSIRLEDNAPGLRVVLAIPASEHQNMRKTAGARVDVSAI
jgi:signal transduction histidine kinase